MDFYVDDLDGPPKFWTDIGLHADMMTPLAHHHIPATSYYVLFDRSTEHGHPNQPPYLALQIRRSQESFTYEARRLPLPSMAQSWLIHRGCPAEAISLRTDLGPEPGNQETVALERRLVSDGDHFAMGYCFTRADPSDPFTVVALRALDDRPVPYRVLVEEIDYKTWTYTLREIGCESVGDALRRCEDRILGRAKSSGRSSPVSAQPLTGQPSRRLR
ncbi:hypothetical protein JGS22_015080 [Streptomyces sp. P38-E01]|uniref:Uncharacterized protein n=1 Tax=Streptomyces tardus TaxID=2780544 RepID=A0A949JG99_9ACTN|nr:hypothetical protein [Streptomyces tardus]MBU7598902.1 hypothetical protein [Streptomyces tardus]